MAKVNSTDFDDVECLLKEYSSIYNGYQFLEDSTNPSNSLVYQEQVKHLINKTEGLVHGVNHHSLFSANEDLTEIPADHLRYILLPALLGYFTSKQTLTPECKGDVGSYRKEVIEKSQTYYKDYLKLCRLYGVETPVIDDEELDENGEVKNKKKPYEKDAVTRKTEKVMRFKAKKSLETKLKDLFTKLNLDHVDDDTKREYYTALINQWVITAVEELEFIEDELAILEHMSKMRSQGIPIAPPKPKGKPSRPFILTKSDLQKQVFGLGYPSVPTYTVEEFYDAQVAAGVMPPPGAGGMPGMENEAAAAEAEAIVKEFKVEQDDEETLQKTREWDDWKDDHRKGWGNRKNMG